MKLRSRFPSPEVVTHGKQHWHRWMRKAAHANAGIQSCGGSDWGILEMVPTFLVKSNVPTLSSVQPYTPLNCTVVIFISGKDVIPATLKWCVPSVTRWRYGEYSKAGEFAYDHPFQWGSKRTGPDLARLVASIPTAGIIIICWIRRACRQASLCPPMAGCWITRSTRAARLP